MTVYRIDPLHDPRWRELLDRHPQASVFHTPGWLAALRQTYGYEPVVYTLSSPTDPLTEGIVFCRVRSWLTGVRLVSLPFSDHCQPLVSDPHSLRPLLAAVAADQQREGWKYAELRPIAADCNLQAQSHFASHEEFCLHTVDLRPDSDAIFRSFHKSCIQRKIRRAEREALTYEAGRSGSLLKQFYQLLMITRRRHQLPPQPMSWFRSLAEHLGDRLTIHVASKDGQPVASIITLLFRQTLVYKYGCSDERASNLGGTPFLFWQAIQEGQRAGATVFDLGRSELGNEGLIAFKEHWGAVRSRLLYHRYPASKPVELAGGWKSRIARSSFARLPNPVLVAAGRLLYRHFG